MTTAAGDADTRVFRVRPDAFYVRQSEGVSLRNASGSFSIRGAKAYDLVAELFANLDGQRCLDDICGDLPESARRSVLRLVETLEHNGFVKEVTHPPEIISAWIRERYAAHLAFLEHHVDRPVARLLRVRSQQVICVGQGTALRAVVSALAEFGIARVRVLTTSQDFDHELFNFIEQARQTDPQFEWELTNLEGRDGLGDLAETELDGADQVLLASDQAGSDDLGEAQRRLGRLGYPTGVLGYCGDFVVAVPSSDGRCWECVHRSIATTPIGQTSALEAAVAPTTIASLHLVQSLFARLAEINIELSDRVTTVEPLAPVVRTHTVAPHPRCSGHAPTAVVALADDPVRPDVPASEDPPELVAVSDRIVLATSNWTDPVVGPLLSLGEDEYDQLPLAASACRVALPSQTATSPRTDELVCRAISARQARNEVVLLALERLAREVSGHDIVGVGWSVAEARYRARVAEAHVLDGTEINCADRVSCVITEFLAETLAENAWEWTETLLEMLPNGFARARVRTADGGSSRGIGIDGNHAVRNALLRAVAGEGAPVAHLAPPVATWSHALAALSDDIGDERDISAMLPFVGSDAHIVAIKEVRG